MDSAETSNVDQLSFEDALKRLEEIVRTLEKGEAPLNRSIELYQEGDRLRRHCEARLKDAQARIEQIAFGSDGKPAGLKPFDGARDRGCAGLGGGRQFLRRAPRAAGRQPQPTVRSDAPRGHWRRQAPASVA